MEADLQASTEEIKVVNGISGVATIPRYSGGDSHVLVMRKESRRVVMFLP